MNVPKRRSGFRGRRPQAAEPPAATGTDQAVPARHTEEQEAESVSRPELVSTTSDPSPAEWVSAATSQWRAALVEAAGRSTLADVGLLGDAALDLTVAHPSGIAQLFAGRPTRLSNLVREEATLGAARRRARAVSARAATYAQQYGIAPTYLAIGVATWTEYTAPDSAHDDVAALATATRHHPEDEHPAESEPVSVARTVRAPVLLRPITLRARGAAESDYELTLEPSLEVNPVLARALRARGALLDPNALARSAFTGAGFDPADALTRLSSLGAAVLEDFQQAERIVVGTFVHPGQILVDDLDRLSVDLERHEVIAALAGAPEAIDQVRVELPEPMVGDRDPAQERGVGDLDAAQQHVLDVVAQGTHVFVDAPADSDVTGTVAALVADAAADGRTVLYVPGHRRAALALEDRLEQLGVADVLLDIAPDAGWRSAAGRRLFGAMTLEPGTADPVQVGQLRSTLAGHRERLWGYLSALHVRREPWGVSAYDAFQALATLAAARPCPATTTRLSAQVAKNLDQNARTAVAEQLVAAAEVGAFTLRPIDTPWFGASISTDQEAADIRARVERLSGPEGLPLALARVAEVAEVTGFTPAVSVADWGEQLTVLAGVRGVLDDFRPLVFERSVADLIFATATRAWRKENDRPTGYWVRRRLRKQAKDLLRPGRHVPDLHAALIEAQSQSEIWRRYCAAGGWPQLPEGLTLIDAEYQRLLADVETLVPVLAGTPEGADLLTCPIAQIAERVERLLADAATLPSVPKRSRLLRDLHAVGLEPLLYDLADRRVPAVLVADELELAWWSTVFEELIAADPALAGYDGRTLGRLVAEYRELDLAQVASLAGAARGRMVEQNRLAMAQHSPQTEALFAELVEDRFVGLVEAFESYGEVARRLRPVLAAAAMLVPQVLPATRTVDLVVVAAADHQPIEVVLPALARGRQIVVIGDPRAASGSAVRGLAEVLPRVSLQADASRRDPYLTAFLIAHGYAGVLHPTPLPSAASAVGFHLVDGTGMPDDSGIVQSTRAEVDRVVELVVRHARIRSEESLAVITASPVHTAQIREAILAQVREDPDLAAALDSGRAEPFVVTDVTSVAGLRRDAVLLSLGFGRTPHGRVLHRFGPISDDGGEGLLLAALSVARQRVDVVSCIAADQLDDERVRDGGPQLYADLLRFAEQRANGDGRALDALLVAGAPDQESTDGLSNGSVTETDRLVIDLAERVWRHGLTVELDYGMPGGLRLPMVVGHPDLPDRLLVAVLTDDDAYVREQSVRVRDRQVPERLERLGWTVVRVWSVAAFIDPDAEVDRIRREVHKVADREIARRQAGRQHALSLLPGVPLTQGEQQWVGAGVDEDSAARALADQANVSASGSPSTASIARIGVPTDNGLPVGGGARPGEPPAMTSQTWTVGATSPAASGVDAIVAAATGADRRAGGIPAVAADIPGVMAAAAPMTGAVPVVPAVAQTSADQQDSRPDIRPGLPISAYSDDQLDDLVVWICAAGPELTDDELTAALSAELGITRRGARVDAVIGAAVRRRGATQ